MNPETTNKVVNLSPPQEWLYKCDCPKCISGAHFNKDIADSYRKRGELTNEVARLKEETKRWKDLFVNFAIVHCAQYGEQHFGKDCLHPNHYDLLEEAGARMVDFKKAELQTTENLNYTEK